MAGMLEDLINILKKQNTHHEQLLGLSLEKKDVIIKNDLEQLQKITSLENILISRNQKLEKNRLELMNDIANVLNLNAESLTVQALAEHIHNQPEAAELTRAGDAARETLRHLRDVNDANKLLIDNSLDYIDYTINVIRSVTLAPTVVDAHGQEIDPPHGFFDARQ